MNMRDFWAKEAAKMRDTSHLGVKTDNTNRKRPLKQPEGNELTGIYAFDDEGVYLGFQGTGKLVQIKVGKILYALNDPMTDVTSIIYNTDKPIFKYVKFIITILQEEIGKMMKESNVVKGRSSLSIAWESIGGELDFTVYHLTRIVIDKSGPHWDPEKEIFKDLGPIFLIADSPIAFNLFDTGNWLWGNAMHRMGYALEETLKAARKYDPKNPLADQRAIAAGWNHFKQ